MKTTYLLGAIAAATMVAGAASAQATLEAVKARGELICGSNTGLTGFGAPDANGNWAGFDVDLCRAVAAAIFGDADKVKFVPTTAQIVSPKTSMLSLVAAGRGIAIVPERMTTLGAQGVAYVRLSDSDAQSVCAILLPTQPTLLGQAFADLLMQDSGVR